MSQKHQVALIGAGRMGQIHGPNAARHPELALRYIVDTDAGLADALAARTGAQVAGLADALGDPAVKAVIVASSTDMHLEHSLASIEAGKAVLCEKPIDLDLAKARAAAAAFEGAPFVLGFNRRFDPHVMALKARIDAGAIGALETLTLINHDPAAPPPAFIPRSGGLFKDFTIHDLDLAFSLLGEPPSEIFATASCLRKKTGTRTMRTPWSSDSAGRSRAREVSTVTSCRRARCRAKAAMTTPPPPPRGGYS